MVSAPPKPREPPKSRPVQQHLIPALKGDYRLLEPGWAGELAPDELEFLQAELASDGKAAFKFGFRRNAKRRAEWGIRKIANDGDPGSRAHNYQLLVQERVKIALRAD